MIKFSVVIPLYNKEKEIADTLNSVLNQSYKADEIIVVDDGSTDNSAKIVENFTKFKEIKLIRQNNMGVSAARNRGIEEAKNEYICFIDADDIWKENFLYEIKKLTEDFPKAILYSTSHMMIDESGNVISSKISLDKNFRGYIGNFIKVFKDNYGLINSSSVCIRKSINPKFPVGEKKGEDICLWLELSLKGKLAFVNKPLSIYKLNASNRSGEIHKEPLIPCQLKWIYKNKDTSITENLGFYIFDMRNRETNIPLPIEERNRLLEKYNIPHVKPLGIFKKEDINEIKNIVIKLNSEKREGIVLKDPNMLVDPIKYTTHYTQYSDLSVAFKYLFDLGIDFMFSRLIREGYQSFEFNEGEKELEKRAISIGKAIVYPMVESIKMVSKGELITEDFELYFDSKGDMDEFLNYLKELHISYVIKERELLKNGAYRIKIGRVYPSTNDKIKSHLKGSLW